MTLNSPEKQLRERGMELEARHRAMQGKVARLSARVGILERAMKVIRAHMVHGVGGPAWADRMVELIDRALGED